MKTASILLAIFVMLSFVTEASAESYGSRPDYTITIGGQSFGFADDWRASAVPFNPIREPKIYLGPFGQHDIPFTATQGLVGFFIILALLVTVPSVLVVRWKRRAAV